MANRRHNGTNSRTAVEDAIAEMASWVTLQGGTRGNLVPPCGVVATTAGALDRAGRELSALPLGLEHLR